jgi:hypothetical protein
MSAIRGYDQLMSALAQVRAFWRQRQILQSILWTLAGILALLCLVSLLDNLTQFNTAGRSLCAIAFYTLSLALFSRLVLRSWLADYRDDFFAALAEESNPTLRNRLVCALQLGRGDQRGHSPELIEAIVQDASRVTGDLELTRGLDHRPFRNAAIAVGVAGLITALYATFWTSSFINGASRILLPWAEIAPYTLSQISDKDLTGNTTVREGDSLVITVRVEGEIPSAAMLWRKTAQGSWQDTAMLPDARDRGLFRVEMSSVMEGFSYYIVAGDTRSPTFEVRVVKPPEVLSYRITYSYPSYTGLAPKTLTQDRGEIAALPGTLATLQIHSSKALDRAVLTLEQGQGRNLYPAGNSLPTHLLLTQGADRQSWETKFILGIPTAKLGDIVHPVIDAAAKYQIRLRDTDGFEDRERLRKTWDISATRDLPPRVEILHPNQDLTLSKPDGKISLAVQAIDDYGVDSVRLLYSFKNRGDDAAPHEIKSFQIAGPAQIEPKALQWTWNLAELKLRGGDQIQFWAVAEDRNTVTGPGRRESAKRSLFVISEQMLRDNLKHSLGDYVVVLEQLIRMQTDNRTQTSLLRPDDDAAGRQPAKLFPARVAAQEAIRKLTNELAREMERDGLPIKTVVDELDNLRVGLMAETTKLFEQARDASATKAEEFRVKSLPLQDKIIEQLTAMLKRLQRNEQAKKALERMAKTDKPAFDKTTNILQDLIKNLDKHLKDSTDLASKFERLPKKPMEDLKADPDALKAVKDYDEFKKRTEKWAKDTVNEMTKLPTGFVDDFGLRKDANRIYEEIESKGKQKAEKMEVSLEDLGAGLGTKMKEDLEMWLPDTADNLKWVLEEPLNRKPFKVPEMPLPKALEDLIGDLLQKADEFDKDADDVTSAWGDNLDQAGWGVSDGPISTFSAKGKTGNDQPNNQELSGRSGDGRRGKSTGQMVGDTSRALPGRPTPARVGDEKYEPGALKQEGSQDPNGATGGGKKAGAGRIGLQGGTPPDLTKDVGRLNEKQMGLREKAEQVARKLEEQKLSTVRLREAIELMKPIDTQNRDLRYEDLAKRRREALQKLRAAFGEIDPTATSINRATDLPPEARKELLQGHDEGYPPGYEELLKNYYKKLSSDGK